MPRKCRYFTHVLPFLDKISSWLREGATENEVIRRLHIGRTAFSDYKRQFPELNEALRTSMEDADRKVETQLFRRCTGYDFTETRVENQGHTREKVVTVTKHIPGDVTAQIFWLTNRMRQKWRHISTLDAHVNEDLELVKFRSALDKMSDSEVRAMIDKMASGELTQ